MRRFLHSLWATVIFAFMEFVKVDDSYPEWSEIWRLYESSFPECERRSFVAHSAAMQDSEFVALAVKDDTGAQVALLFYWHYDDTVYIEHLAVAEGMRGRKIGSQLMSEFLETVSGKTVVLEIDPPLDEISCRRKRFYERLGFKACPYDYIHPSYRTADNAARHSLVIMSYPEIIPDRDYERFVGYVRDRVLLYVD